MIRRHREKNERFYGSIVPFDNDVLLRILRPGEDVHFATNTTYAKNRQRKTELSELTCGVG